MRSQHLELGSALVGGSVSVHLYSGQRGGRGLPSSAGLVSQLLAAVRLVAVMFVGFSFCTFLI